jgi:hypothetical protein
MNSFGKCTSKKDGLNLWCRKCYSDRYFHKRGHILALARARYPRTKEQKRLYDRQRREKLKLAGIDQFTANRRSRHYKNRYGITLLQYNEMFDNQNGKCAICDVSQEKQSKRLSVDHCHMTGKIRKLLCDGCNKGLGHFKDKPELLLKAIEYLKTVGRT